MKTKQEIEERLVQCFQAILLYLMELDKKC